MAGKIQGSVVSITAAGSLVTDLTADQLRAAPRDERTQIRCDEHFTQGLFPSNHGEPEMTFLAILDDSGPLQLEIVGENASLDARNSRRPAGHGGMGMKATRDELQRWDREVVWHAFTQMAEYEPLLIERAHGCTLVDIDGREYLDGVSSLWCNIHGHAHPRLDAAIRDQLAKVAHVTSLGLSNPTTVMLAKRLIELAPPGLPHVFFASDGASAVEVALKMAFQYWRQCPDPRPGKTKYLAFHEAYHGDTLGSVSVGGVARFHAMFRSLLFDVIRLPTPDCYRLPPGVTRATACRYYLDQLQRALHLHHEDIAAVVIEPLVQCAAGMITHPPATCAACGN